MERTIRVYNKIADYYIELSDDIRRYRYWNNNKGMVSICIEIEKLLRDKEYFNDLINQGFNLVVDINKKSEKQKIPISIEYLEESLIRGKFEEQRYKSKLEKYLSLSDKERKDSGESEVYLRNMLSYRSLFDNIYIYRKIRSKDIREFFEITSEIEMKNLRIPMWLNSVDYKGSIYFSEPLLDKKLKEKYDNLFGKPMVIPESMPEKGSDFYKYYVVSSNMIDKIIGIKKNFIIDSFNREEYEYNGDVKEYVLDLHQFDENTYQILKSYNIIEMENTPDKKEEIKQTWWQKIFGK